MRGEDQLHGLVGEAMEELLLRHLLLIALSLPTQELAKHPRGGIALRLVQRAEQSLRPLLGKVHPESSAPLVGLGGVGHAQEVGERARDDSQFLRRQVRREVGHGAEPGSGGVAFPSTLLRHVPHLLDHLQDVLPMVQSDGVAEKGAHRAHVRAEHAIVVRSVLVVAAAGEGGLVHLDGGEEGRLIEGGEPRPLRLPKGVARRRRRARQVAAVRQRGRKE
mmetsp:Transcript_54391/g.115522  ORF Transcript_54391/g.115522 Transcript_54391/m.115522 type:complete len:220 (+) Transcript_54391:2498-3157(+)